MITANNFKTKTTVLVPNANNCNCSMDKYHCTNRGRQCLNQSKSQTSKYNEIISKQTGIEIISNFRENDIQRAVTKWCCIWNLLYIDLATFCRSYKKHWRRFCLHCDGIYYNLVYSYRAVRNIISNYIFHIDTEHIAIDRSQLSWMCRAYSGMGITPICRVPEPEPYR